MGRKRQFGPGRYIFIPGQRRGQDPFKITEGSIVGEEKDGPKGPNGASPLEVESGRVTIFLRERYYRFPWPGGSRTFWPSGKKE